MLPSPALAASVTRLEAPIAPTRCTGCGALAPVGGFGARRDGRQNTRCASCRTRQATLGADGWNAHRVDREEPRDARALRVVERFCGLPYALWGSAAGRLWEVRRGVRLQELWTLRMVTLMGRALRALPPDAPPPAAALDLLERYRAPTPRRRGGAPSLLPPA